MLSVYAQKLIQYQTRAYVYYPISKFNSYYLVDYISSYLVRQQWLPINFITLCRSEARNILFYYCNKLSTKHSAEIKLYIKKYIKS